MLVLNRKPGERIAIGNNITIVVTRVAAGRVTIGIDAPPSVPIRRTELAVCPEAERRLIVVK